MLHLNSVCKENAPTKVVRQKGVFPSSDRGPFFHEISLKMKFVGGGDFSLGGKRLFLPSRKDKATLLYSERGPIFLVGVCDDAKEAK